MDTFTIVAPDDMHLHLREGEALPGFARAAAAGFARGLVMPNTKPPVRTATDLEVYRSRIHEAAPGFRPLMTFKLLESTPPEDIADLADAGAVAGKLYPRGVTTNAEDGVRDLAALGQTLDAMAEAGLVLCIHAEDPEAQVLERESAYLPKIEGILSRHPKLRLVVEHVSTAAAVRFVKQFPERVGATITVHHLLFTLDDLLGDKLDPHLFCKPVVKQREDRDALQQAVLTADSRFFFGSDSAPHPKHSKETDACAAGVYTAPVALPLLLEFFETQGMLRAIEDFTSRFGAEFYGLERNDGQLRCVKEPWLVPGDYDGVVPLGAGRTLSWSVDAIPPRPEQS